MNLLGIDPGIRASGVCLAAGGEIVAAEYVPNPRKKGGTLREVYSMALAISGWYDDEIDRLVDSNRGVCVHVVCERPLKPWKSTFLSLQPLMAVGAGVAGLLAGYLVETEAPWEYFPADWKGTGSADACTLRVRRRLTVAEFARIKLPEKTCPACAVKETHLECARPTWCLAHNVYDAVGITLTALGRFEKVHGVRR